MNCERGDLAMVIRGSPRENVGRVVRCIAIDDFATGICNAPMWQYEGDLIGMLGVRSSAVADNCLKPIRDPGDDAVDETLIYAGDPQVREVSHG